MTKTQLRRERRRKKRKCPRCGCSTTNPEDGRCHKCRARRAVYKAVKRKRLVKKSCQHPDCDVKQTEFHHAWGYSMENRYRGIWLCVKHHLEADSAQRKPKGRKNIDNETTIMLCLAICLASFVAIIVVQFCGS